MAVTAPQATLALEKATHDPGGKAKPPWPKGSEISAIMSDCGLYRYELAEIWDRSRPFVMFVMMNPSVATIGHADPTLIKTGAYARRWGYGGQLIGNVHAYRATDPRQLLDAADPVGPENDRAMLHMASYAKIVVLAFGLPPKPLRPRATRILQLLRGAGATLTFLRLTKDGIPGHPLYLPGNLTPQPYTR
jgi:hypothetical protein